MGNSGVTEDGGFEKAVKKINEYRFPDLGIDKFEKVLNNGIKVEDISSPRPKEYFEKTQKYQEESLKILKSIEVNTANLNTLVELINNANDKQDDLIGLYAEMLVIAKAKNKKEAESLFKKVKSKIEESVNDVDSFLKIFGWASAIYQAVVTMLNK